MPVHNQEVANIFQEVAELLAIKGANPFRIRAYQQATTTIGRLPRSVAEMVRQGEDLTELPGIGVDLAGKIQEILKTGKLRQLEELKKKTPPGITQLLKIPSLGPKRVQALYKKLHIECLGDLETCLAQGKLRKLRGFGEKSEQRILEELKRTQGVEKRFPWITAQQMSAPLVDDLKKSRTAERLMIAGSFRRRKETVGDIDILATSPSPAAVLDRFARHEDVAKVLSKGPTRSTVILRSGLQIDLRVVPAESYGAALIYFTGSKAHNINLRRMAQDRGLKINEYGLFKGKKRLAGKSEEDIYRFFGLSFIPPELREDRGEIEAAKKGTLPHLIRPEDLRGDLHSHTDATDGRDTLEDMAREAEKKGLEYLAITDHSKHVGITHGLDAKRLARQIKAIERLNGKLKGCTLLKGIEVDILEDGSLALPNDILKELDLTVCSIHTQFNLPGKKQTERILKAMDNPYFKILGHPTGRLLNERRAYDLDLERVMAEAKQRGHFLEVNAQPDRLDLDDSYCKMAKEMGVMVAISTDAHAVDNLDFLPLGAGQAARGWLEKKDVLNARPLKQCLQLLRHHQP